MLGHEPRFILFGVLPALFKCAGLSFGRLYFHDLAQVLFLRDAATSEQSHEPDTHCELNEIPANHGLASSFVVVVMGGRMPEAPN